MRQLRRTAIALVVAAFLIAPTAILAQGQPSVGSGQAAPDPAASSAANSGGVGVGPATPATPAAPTVEATQTVAEAPSATPAKARSGATAGASATTAVKMVDFAFSPVDVTVDQGDQITWTNTGKVAHTATAQTFNSGPIQPGAAYTHTFNEPGTIDYVCSFHPQMTGTITVVARNSGGNGTGNNNNNTNNNNNNNDNGSNSGGTGFDPNGSSGTDAVTPTATDSSSLPTTGLNAILLAEIAIGLIAMGLLIRQLVRN